jgi:hypothetical protein
MPPISRPLVASDAMVRIAFALRDLIDPRIWVVDPAVEGGQHLHHQLAHGLPVPLFDSAL